MPGTIRSPRLTPEQEDADGVYPASCILGQGMDSKPHTTQTRKAAEERRCSQVGVTSAGRWNTRARPAENLVPGVPGTRGGECKGRLGRAFREAVPSRGCWGSWACVLSDSGPRRPKQRQVQPDSHVIKMVSSWSASRATRGLREAQQLTVSLSEEQNSECKSSASVQKTWHLGVGGSPQGPEVRGGLGLPGDEGSGLGLPKALALLASPTGVSCSSPALCTLS